MELGKFGKELARAFGRRKAMDRRSDIDLKDTWMEIYYGKPRYRNR